MDILLINPPCIMRKGNFWRNIIANTPALGLGYLASSLEKNGFKVEILDAGVEEREFDEVDAIIKSKRANWFGISATSYTYASALKVAASIKRYHPHARIVLGGIHPTLFPNDALQNPEIDIVVRHEGDITLSELLKNPVLQEIPGISFRDNGKICHNPDRPLIDNLDQVPFPAYHLLPMKKGHLTLGCAKHTPAAMLIGSRGCPFHCTFCTTAGMGEIVRYRSAENILEEIKRLMSDYGIREIHFQDDNFSLNRNNVIRFCELIIEGNIDLSWLCMARVSSVTPEMLKLMHKAGCHQICYGIESGDETILQNIKKTISTDQVRKAVRWTKEAGIEARGSFILGNPGETEKTLKKTFNFMKELDLDLMSMNIMTPMPGTEIHRWAKREGLLMTEDWNEYTFTQSVIRLPTISPEKVDAALRRFYRGFYIRPSFILKRLAKIRSFNDLKTNLKAFFLLSTN
jgi:radical SAM superfamily enzyme YgiQ (UPF0313 family)